MSDANANRDALRRAELLAQWASIEAGITQTDPLDYDREWGRLREAFYEKTKESIPIDPASAARLRSLKDRYKGNRIFIIGNGPSLNRTPLRYLENEYTFAFNRAYLLYDRIKWRPTFYTALDWRVVPDVAREINGLTGSTFFFEERFRGILREGEDVFHYTHGMPPGTTGNERIFSTDISTGLRGAGSVVGAGIQLAFYMGFDPIYLIGCDLGYKVTETVQQEGEDRFGNGVKLHLTSTQDDDQNHFDPRYFGAGRRWHDPNVKRMVDGHKQCRTGIEAAGRRIYNATVGGELEVYDRVDFHSLFDASVKKGAYKEYPREDRAHVDETHAIAHLLQHRQGESHTMIDVGAHMGTSAVFFEPLGWKIHCFEPDPDNRARLMAKYGKNPRIIIDPRAVSDKPATGVSFFKSNESSGISALHAFRDTHQDSAKVDVTTLADVVKDRGIKKIDFLKIDVEGYDFSVLKGVPWDVVMPEVVECEFEDAKTVKLGHTWTEIAEYLRQKGYAIYVSEWYPIVRYGVRHDWRRVTNYREWDVPNDAWGNLLAFKVDPGLERIEEAFHAVMKLGDTPAQPQVRTPVPLPAPKPAAKPAPFVARPVTPAQQAKPAAPAAAAPPAAVVAPKPGVATPSSTRLQELSKKFGAIAASMRDDRKDS